MLQLLLNHSNDLKKLENDGLELEINNGHLFIHNVPYVNAKKEIKRGTLVSTLNSANNKTLQPETHVVNFCGDFPCDKQGNPMEKIRHQTTNQLCGGVMTSHSFSNKPPQGFNDYYEKMTNYINIISAPAFSIDNRVTARTFKPIKISGEESVFNYFDSNSSRSGTLELSNKLKNQKTAIIGLGGTGSYILDFLSKTPVLEIHLFDGDLFKHHNAFRAPGAATFEELSNSLFKTDYFQKKYSPMRKNIYSHPIYIDANTVLKLKELQFVFICVDDASAKKIIIDFLTENKINFIDVGMGVDLVDNKLRGTIRVTTGLFDKNDHISKRISFVEPPEDEYHQNIQMPELNALNATLAIIKWKKLFDYYHDHEKEHNTLYDIDGNHITNDEKN